MSQSFSFCTEGLILHRYPFQSSCLVKFLTEERGLLPAVVKHGSSRGGHRNLIQPFSWIMGEVSGRGEVKTLRNIEIIENIAPHSYKALSTALYLNELILFFVKPYEMYPSLLPMLKATVQHLSEGALEPTLRTFELYLMDLIGYRLSLTHDHQGQAVQPLSFYLWFPGKAPVHQEKNAVLREDEQRSLLSGTILLEISQQNWDNPECLKAAKYILRQWIDHYAEGRKLRTRELFQVLS
jgi:DNA repair protein RecO (recombination protein O)